MQRKGEGSTPPLRIGPLPAGSTPVDVVVAGECSVDLVAVVDRLPRAGEKVSAARFRRLPGGQSATAAVGCARLGWRTRFVGVAGDDEEGRQIELALRREGVDAEMVWRKGIPSRTAVVLVEEASGERAVISHRAAELTLAEGERPVAAALGGRLLLVDAVDPGFSLELARAAEGQGIPSILDVDTTGPETEALLNAVDVIIVPGALAQTLTGRDEVGAALAALIDAFEPVAAVATLGADGALGLADGQEFRVPPPATGIRAVDTTGAGDAFRAGFAAAWLELGSAAPLDALLTFATVVAALNCREIGAQTALPARAELDRFL